MHTLIERVTASLIERSRPTRQAYLERLVRAVERGRQRTHLDCGNLAHSFAACSAPDKQALAGGELANIAIVSSYNDILSAHQPLQNFPALIKQAVHEAGGVAQFAGGVPAMCDGVTQGQPGMELSLFSRDVIALATAVALSHNLFDGALYLGVCDKIVPGLLIGALSFGHLPALFVPAGPMPSGPSNAEKQRVRQRYAEGKAGRGELLASESASYHSPGTCTFYGTANSNQLLVELMGLHLPGASFVNPNTPLREALTRESGKQILKFTSQGGDFRPIGQVVDEKAIINAVVGLLATGGSTNHTLHLLAIAQAAGIRLEWGDLAALSQAVPLLARIYPNGEADINQFQAAGGMALLIRTLLDAGLIHGDILTMGNERGLAQYTREPWLDGAQARWREGPTQTRDASVLRGVEQAFSFSGGLQVVQGNLGKAVIKVSAVKPQQWLIEAPARVFDEQDDLLAAFTAGELERDFVAVLRYQGPHAMGMPELHKLTPALGVLQDRGFKVALVTDGRMSGASGKVPAAIHLSPEAARGGPLAKVRDGDPIRLDAAAGTLDVLVDAAEFAARVPEPRRGNDHEYGTGRELFAAFRELVGPAEAGASVLYRR
ncbi:MAG: phosphogluconate dehydratase [Pseudomonadales bacterium]|jgi:phosphogluconate dehydratase|nr:phosphogluconate dehydratase [Pseudomonadales bacterium]